MKIRKNSVRALINARTILLMFVLLLGVHIGIAGGAWIRQPGSLYAKLGLTTLSTNKFHASDGSTVNTADFGTQTVQLYGEYGVLENFSLVFDVPVFKRSAYVTSNAVSGFGDVGIEAK
mgnify:CR=1 FL=1